MQNEIILNAQNWQNNLAWQQSLLTSVNIDSKNQYGNQALLDYKTQLKLDKVIKYDQLDKGFILRASCPEVAKAIKQVIKHGQPKNDFNQQNQNMEVDQVVNEEEINQADQQNDDVMQSTEINIEQLKKEKKKKKKKKREMEEEMEMKRKQQEEERNKKMKQQSFEIISLCPEKQLFGLKIYDTVYLATLIDLPTIIEAMKTLDFNNFFKSQDASQMLYVHKNRIDDFTDKSKEQVFQIVSNFWAVRDDPEFFNQLYQRTKIKQKLDKNQNQNDIIDENDLFGIDSDNKIQSEKDQQKQYPFINETFKLRNGISPIAQNIINIRFKQKPKFDVPEVKKVESTLKDLIEYGFSEHIEEEMLTFDKQGNLEKVVRGGRVSMGHGGPGNQYYKGGGPETAGGEDDGEEYDDDSYSNDDNSSFFGANQSIRSKSYLKSELASERGHGALNKNEESLYNENLENSLQKQNVDNKKKIIGNIKVPLSSNMSPMNTKNEIFQDDMPPPDSQTGFSQVNSWQNTPQKFSQTISQFKKNDQIPKEVIDHELNRLKNQKDELQKCIEDCKNKVIKFEKQGLSSQASDMKKQLKEFIDHKERLKEKIKNFKD